MQGASKKGVSCNVYLDEILHVLKILSTRVRKYVTDYSMDVEYFNSLVYASNDFCVVNIFMNIFTVLFFFQVGCSCSTL